MVSRGTGIADAPVPPRSVEPRVSGGSFSPVNPYLREYRHLPDPVPAPKEDALDISAIDLGKVTIDPKRAGVSCDAQLRVRTNGPLAVTLLGCGRTESFNGTGPGLEGYNPADPLALLGNPAQGAPLPPELGGNVPQPPLQGLPPLRFPPNGGENPRPSDQ